MTLYPPVAELIRELEQASRKLPAERLILLESLAKRLEKPMDFVAVCTHNARRSQFTQLWVEVAASYYQLPWRGFSAGTETTRLHPAALATMQRAGFRSEELAAGDNPEYRLFWSEEHSARFYSKDLESAALPKEKFTALLLCEQAMQQCPYVPGAQHRFEMPVPDPGVFDNSPEADMQYDAAFRQIGSMVLYLAKVCSRQE